MFVLQIPIQTVTLAVYSVYRLVWCNRGEKCFLRGTHWVLT